MKYITLLIVLFSTSGCKIKPVSELEFSVEDISRSPGAIFEALNDQLTVPSTASNGDTFSIDILANDSTDIDLASVVPFSHPAVLINFTRPLVQVTILDQTYSGILELDYQISKGANSASAKLFITLNGTTAPPSGPVFTAQNDQLNISQTARNGDVFTVDILANDSSGVDFTSISAFTHPAITVSFSSPLLRVTIVDESFSGVHEVNYQIAKGTESATAKVFIAMSGAPASPVLTGAQLYAANCKSCHGDLAVSTKKNSSFHSIKNAIANNAVMNSQSYLTSLSDPDIQKIADALVDNGNGSGVDEDRLDIKLRSAGRRYIFSVLKDVFGPQIESDYTTKQLSIFNKQFGGACDPYKAEYEQGGNEPFPYDSCRGYMDLAISHSPILSVTRSGFSINVCDRLVTNSTAFDYAMNQVGGHSQAFSAAAFTQLYQLFYLYENPDASLLPKVQTVFGSGNNKEGWRKVLYTLCISPEWQII